MSTSFTSSKTDAILARFPGGSVRPEYPRPQLRRPHWASLNGVWQFAFDAQNRGIEENWREKTFPDGIVVPFAPQTELSGVGSRKVIEVVWYARDFEVPAAWRCAGRSVLLHFGACDYHTTLWLNGQEVGQNRGGHVPFSFDITPYLQDENRLCLRVVDSQSGDQPRGKQSLDGLSHGIDYFCTTGIWQSVWLESVPSLRIQNLVITPLVGPDAGQDALEITVHLHAPAGGWQLQIEVLESDDDAALVIASAENAAAMASARLRIEMPHCQRWSPDAPHLYGLRVRLLKNGVLQDEVRSYAGIRGVGIENGLFCLNGTPLYLQSVLDQGYWPDGGLTAPSDEALSADVEWIKAFGFNGARKHQKVEDPRWLYHCDRLGLLVWGEMANARTWSLEAEEVFLAEWERAVRRDFNHPCVVTWVPLNESFGIPGLRTGHLGQYAFIERIVALTRRLDGTRPIVDNDGWEHSDVTDIVAIHDYTTGEKMRSAYTQTLQSGELPQNVWRGDFPIFALGARYHGQPIMFSEVGGFLMMPPQSRKPLDGLYSVYNTSRTSEELLAQYRELMETLAALPFVSGWCYTQLTDIEQEANGLLTPDRKPKIAPEKIAVIHRELWGTSKLPNDLTTSNL